MARFNEAETIELKRIYSITTNKELAKIFGTTVPSIRWFGVNNKLKKADCHVKKQQSKKGVRSTEVRMFNTPTKIITQNAFYKSVYKTFRLNPNIPLGEIADLHECNYTMVNRIISIGLKEKWHQIKPGKL